MGPRGDTIYAHDPARLVVPASNMKLVTVASALITLGPDYRFRANAVALPLRDTVPSDFGPMYDTLWLRNRPLRDVAAKVLKPSQNRLAEQLFYTMALERTGVASRDSAAAVVRRQLAAWALPADGYLVADGSGYNRANYLSAETIVGILQRMRSSPLSALWYDALPIAGVDGTLVRRMRATRAEGNAHAKTGSLGAVRSLAGYVTTAQGEELTFAFLCNGFTVPSDSVTGVMDRMVAMLADLSTSPAPIP